MDDLTERLHGLDEVDVPDVWPDAASRRPSGPDEPPLGHRLAVIGFAAMIGVGALALVFAALRESGTPGNVLTSPASGGMVRSGGSYELSDLSVEFPTARKAEAKVFFSSAWTSETFPGDVPCTFALFDEEGTVLALGQSEVTTIKPRGSDAYARVSVPDGVSVPEGTPVDAEARCGLGMVYEGPWEISNLSLQGTHVVGDLKLVGADLTGTAACAGRWLDAVGTEHIRPTGAMTTGSAEQIPLMLVPDDLPVGDIPEIRCESYRSPDQLDESYWLPWRQAATGWPVVDVNSTPAEQIAALARYLEKAKADLAVAEARLDAADHGDRAENEALVAAIKGRVIAVETMIADRCGRLPTDERLLVDACGEGAV